MLREVEETGAIVHRSVWRRDREAECGVRLGRCPGGLRNDDRGNVGVRVMRVFSELGLVRDATKREPDLNLGSQLLEHRIQDYPELTEKLRIG